MAACEGRRWNKVSDEHPDGPNDDITKPIGGVYLDHDGGGISPKKPLIHPENKLIIPRRIIIALSIHAGRKLSGGVDPCLCIGAHFLGNGLQILGRNDVYLQKLERFGAHFVAGLVMFMNQTCI